MALSGGLASFWGMEETSGSRADSHGSNTLTDNNTVLYAAGIIGNGADFESTNSEYLSRTDPASLEPGDTDFSFALWAKLESKSVDMGIFGKYNSNTDQREYVLQYNNVSDRFKLYVSTDGTFAGQTTLLANTLGSPSTAVWYFIVCRHDATANTIEIGVNNGTFNSTSHTGGAHQGTADFHIGTLFGTIQPFDGIIDEAAFWDKKLSDAEVGQLYNGGAGLAYPFASPRSFAVIVG